MRQAHASVGWRQSSNVTKRIIHVYAFSGREIQNRFHVYTSHKTIDSESDDGPLEGPGKCPNHLPHNPIWYSGKSVRFTSIWYLRCGHRTPHATQKSGRSREKTKQLSQNILHSIIPNRTNPTENSGITRGIRFIPIAKDCEFQGKRRLHWAELGLYFWEWRLDCCNCQLRDGSKNLREVTDMGIFSPGSAIQGSADSRCDADESSWWDNLAYNKFGTLGP